MRRIAPLIILILGLSCLAATGADRADKMPVYQSPYYVIHSDLDKDAVREAAARMTSMAEEYNRRTKDFAGQIRSKQPFYLFSKADDYYAAGGMAGSAGMYNGKALMAIAAADGRDVWHVVQHEGFHQFVNMVIGGRMPIWVNEGLAEYFGLGQWTGDDLLTGLIPPGRLARVKEMINKKQTLPFLDMVVMEQSQWNGALDIRNYDQAWSMIHFLVHADGGKYQKALSGFIGDVGRRRPVKQAFIERFGRDTVAFQKRYNDWWLGLDENPTKDLYTMATAQTLTSFLARAAASNQKFKDIEEFWTAAKDGKLQNDTKQWLPQTLLEGALEHAKGNETWSLDVSAARPRLLLTTPEGMIFTGTFVLGNHSVSDVVVRMSKGAVPKSAETTSAGAPVRKVPTVHSPTATTRPSASEPAE